MTSILDQIIKADDLQTKTVDVKEWGVKIPLRELTSGQRNELSMMFKDGDIPENYQAKIIIMAARDPSDTSKPLFTDEHIEILNGKKGTVIDDLVSEIQALSKMGADAVEEAEKNS